MNKYKLKSISFLQIA